VPFGARLDELDCSCFEVHSLKVRSLDVFHCCPQRDLVVALQEAEVRKQVHGSGYDDGLRNSFLLPFGQSGLDA